MTDLKQISSILACEIECSVFEAHVQPALEIARKVLVSQAAPPPEDVRDRFINRARVTRELEEQVLAARGPRAPVAAIQTVEQDRGDMSSKLRSIASERISDIELSLELLAIANALSAQSSIPIPMLLFCPKCGEQHVDAPEDHEVDKGSHVDVVADWSNPPHRSHLCHACGTIWRPTDVATTGVKAIETRGKADTWGGIAADTEPLHASDCAIHNEPAYPNGPCDCGGLPGPFRRR